MNALSTPSAEHDLTELVVAVFGAWRDAGIPFVVLRNYEQLPRHSGNDIDVLVAPERIFSAEQLLIQAAQRTGYRLHNRAEFSPLVLFFYHPATRQQIQFDLFPALKWRGFFLQNAGEILARRVEKELFAIPHPADEAVNNLLTRLIYHGYVKPEYKPKIYAGVKEHRAHVAGSLTEMFGADSAESLVKKIEADRWEDVKKITGALRRKLIFRRLARQPLVTLTAQLRDFCRLLKRWLRPPGLVVVLLGADGCGKSTVATQVCERLRRTFASDKGLRVHWKPQIFSRSRRAARPPSTNPHSQPPRGKFASLLALLVHWSEFLAGTLLQFRPVQFRNGLVMIERYHYDFIVDPLRFRLNVPETFTKKLFRLLPKPDLVFLLDAPPEVLQARKQEVPFAETVRQREAYRKLLAELPHGKMLDVSRPLEAVVDDMTLEILQHLETRQNRRL